MKVQKAKERNDIVQGLKLKVQLKKENSKNRPKLRISALYSGKYGLGYDGCGSHTHKD
jgi:hypothetical protein